MQDGILIINKPEGWTSQDVCTKLRHRLHIKKIGHTGTLDPMATGVLPVCIGKATRIIEYYDLDHKSYHAGMQLGLTSDTLDIWGKTSRTCRVIIEGESEDASCDDHEDDARNVNDTCDDHESDTSDLNDVCDEEESVRVIKRTDIKKAFAEYTGRISQVPPKYSALRVDGKRAYDLARQGMEFEIRPREITIFSNEIASIDAGTGVIEFDVTCSKGTYIRTICDDIGRTLGCSAVMSSLVRTGSGCFNIEDALTIEQIMDMSDEEIESAIIPMDTTLTSLGTASLNDNRVIAFANGNSSAAGYRITGESSFARKNDGKHSGAPVYRVYNEGKFLGTALIVNGELVPDKVIYRGE